MSLRLTELSPNDQYFYFEGYTWGLDEGRRASEQLRADHKQEIQILWHIIYGLRNDFTLADGSVRAHKPNVRALNGQNAGRSL